jgi:WD40 repeat protein
VDRGDRRGIAFSPDRRTLATSDDDGVIRLWNVTDPPDVKQSCWVSFSPDGHTWSAPA